MDTTQTLWHSLVQNNRIYKTMPVTSRVYCCAAIVIACVQWDEEVQVQSIAPVQSLCRMAQHASDDMHKRLCSFCCLYTCCIYTISSSHHCSDMKIEATLHIYRPRETRTKINVYNKFYKEYIIRMLCLLHLSLHAHQITPTITCHHQQTSGTPIHA